MSGPRLAAAFGAAAWFVSGLAGYYFDGGIALGLVCGLLAAVLGAVLGGTSDIAQALNGRPPQVLTPARPSLPHV
jgi:hypothetical protein